MSSSPCSASYPCAPNRKNTVSLAETTDLDQPENGLETANFDSLGLPSELLAAIHDLGYTEPSAIQARAIPALLSGRDITGVAQTGTGKTAAFGLPLLASIDPTRYAPQALVLTPTRELALQVADHIESYATHLDGVRILAVYGGAPYVPQQKALRAGVHVVVGTPGRIMDHMERGALVLDDARFLVLDEADEMLRMGFAEDVDQIFSHVPCPRQVALFSATMPPAIRAIAEDHLTDPVEVAVTRQSSTVALVAQGYAVVPFRHKIGALTRILATTEADATIVFTRTRSAAEEVGAALIEKGISAATISGDVAQKEREKIVERLRGGQLDVLVATDVAARGLDVDRVGLVVNFDIPREAEAYVHRIGRTGRAGRTGQAISFITPHERSKLRHIEALIKVPIAEVPIPSPRDVSVHKASRLLAQIPARLANGRLDMYRELVKSQIVDERSKEHDAAALIDLAATLLALSVGDDGPRARAEQEEFEREQAEARASRAARETRKAFVDQRGSKGDRFDKFDRDRRSPRDDAERPRGIRRPAAGTRYRVAVGHKDGVNPGGIVGAITGEGGLAGSDVGKIDIFGSFSLVDITAPLTEAQFDRLSRARVSGRALRLSIDRGAPEPRGRDSRDFRENRNSRSDRYSPGERAPREDRYSRDERPSWEDRPVRGDRTFRGERPARGERPTRGGDYDSRPKRKPRW